VLRAWRKDIATAEGEDLAGIVDRLAPGIRSTNAQRIAKEAAVVTRLQRVVNRLRRVRTHGHTSRRELTSVASRLVDEYGRGVVCADLLSGAWWQQGSKAWQDSGHAVAGDWGDATGGSPDT